MRSESSVRRFTFCKISGVIGFIVSLADYSQRFARIGHESAVISPDQITLSLIGAGLWPIAIICFILAAYVLLEVLPDGYGPKAAYPPLAFLLPVIIYSALVLILHKTGM